MQPLNSDDREAVVKLARELRRGAGLTQARLDELAAEWEPRARPDRKDCAEDFAVCSPAGKSARVVGPRWAFHLFGLRHRAAEIGLATPSGLLLLQRRSATKENWPSALDMAVAGHIPQGEGGGDLTWEEGAWKEIEEEIGLAERDAATTLAEGRLLRVGTPYACYDAQPDRNPPFFNAESRQILFATLTGEGLSRLRFPDGEAAGLLFVDPDTAWELLTSEGAASGMRYSLPRLLDWLEKQS